MATIAPDIAPSTGSLLESMGAHRVLVDAAPAPFDIISSKISIPVARPDSIVRTALVNRLRAKTSTSVISLIAPAGYGKTTLLCQWSKRDDRPFIWLTADRWSSSHGSSHACSIRSAWGATRARPTTRPSFARVASNWSRGCRV